MMTGRTTPTYIIAVVIILTALTGCNAFQPEIARGETLKEATNSVALPLTGVTQGPTQTSEPTPVVVLPTPTPQAAILPTAPATEAPFEATVAADNLNLRIGPGFDHAVVRLLQGGLTVKADGRSVDGLWIEIHTTDGSAGWVFGAYLESKSDLASLPVTEAHGGVDDPAPVQNTTFSILMTIEDNIADVKISRFPPNRKIAVSLGPDGKTPSLVVASGQTDASGKATLSFEMPSYWEDGSPVTQSDLVLAVSTSDLKFSRQINVVYIH